MHTKKNKKTQTNTNMPSPHTLTFRSSVWKDSRKVHLQTPLSSDCNIDHIDSCIKRASLSSYLPFVRSKRKAPIFEAIPKKISKSKQMFSGSMTVEAAIVLPLFLFFFLNLISFIEMMRLHANFEMALWETGNHLAVYGYAYEEAQDHIQKGMDPGTLFGEQFVGVAFTQTYVKHQIITFLDDTKRGNLVLSGGTDSLNFLESSIMGEDECIDIILTYPVKVPYAIPGIASFRMVNRYYGRAWTGYDVSSEAASSYEEQDYVYVTEHGTVWHETKKCTYLKLTVQETSLQAAIIGQNQYGVLYTECALCKGDIHLQNVYVTESGTHYHYSSSCSGIKRTIIPILRSDAGAYRPCSRCTS